MIYKIKIEPSAVEDLIIIRDFISKNDSEVKAVKFLNLLKEQIKNLEFMPLKYRKSYYHDDENIRDLIFKGYTVVFKIKKEIVYVLAIFRQKNY
ncbi:MAG: type II toxin-antitoxin system RelE/ParE family toxin [Campylobacterales bacterium]|nr:type II toxin-antitoxin system RelE/ParE family toxin [Campylobacterales bacterium]